MPVVSSTTSHVLFLCLAFLLSSRPCHNQRDIASNVVATSPNEPVSFSNNTINTISAAAKNNSTMNRTATTTSFPVATKGKPEWMNILGFLGLAVATIPGVLGNIVLISSILHSHELRNQPIYIAMTGLAFVEFLFAYGALYPIGGSILTGRHMPDFDHRLWSINVNYFGYYCYCAAYVTIALNRWMIICHPNVARKTFTKRNMLIFVALWPVISVILMAPILSGRCCMLDFAPDTWLEFYHIPEHLAKESNIQLTMCWIASCVTTGLGLIVYTLAFWRIRSLKQRIGTKGIGAGKQAVANSDVRLLAQFAIVTGSFTIYWVGVHILIELGLGAMWYWAYCGYIIFGALVSVNPIVYYLINRTLRSAAKDLFATILGRKGMNDITETSQQKSAIGSAVSSGKAITLDTHA